MNHKVMVWETNKRTLWQGRELGYFVWKFPAGVESPGGGAELLLRRSPPEATFKKVLETLMGMKFKVS